ncbi:uncharacterized protein LOC130266135 isoform X2 [Oenanthe melanoleuca]|uniref:uncharacterized protein LOC130266135 isoform X2 n=1 Tax=Oenanthe melanoleuca TaxID=2939378 RepID=UPI0024C15502|nr:uncharacterized protein LOC130266135 isoform X2 [Oenanthe melanoleuca]
MAGRCLNLSKLLSRIRRRGLRVDPAQQPEEPEQFQPMQDGAAMDRTEGQDPTRGRFRRALKMFWKFVPLRHRKARRGTEGTAEPDSRLTELQTEPDVSPDLPESLRPAQRGRKGSSSQGKLGQPSKSSPCLPQVPAMVKSIHQRLTSQGTLDAKLHTDILRLAGEHPADVVLTLLRCAPTCDRAAATMWRAIGTSGPTVEKVLPTLLCVMEDWPLHSMFTSDGDDTHVFVLAATLVLWVMVQLPKGQKAMRMHASEPLYMALLMQDFITSQPMPKDVDKFWRACQEQHRLPRKPNRLALQTMQALLTSSTKPWDGWPGMAGRYQRGTKDELQVLREALSKTTAFPM